MAKAFKYIFVFLALAGLAAAGIALYKNYSSSDDAGNNNGNKTPGSNTTDNSKINIGDGQKLEFHKNSAIKYSYSVIEDDKKQLSITADIQGINDYTRLKCAFSPDVLQPVADYVSIDYEIIKNNESFATSVTFNLTFKSLKWHPLPSNLKVVLDSNTTPLRPGFDINIESEASYIIFGG